MGILGFLLITEQIENMIIDSYPLPRINEFLSRLQGAKYFSRLDLYNIYFQISIED